MARSKAIKSNSALIVFTCLMCLSYSGSSLCATKQNQKFIIGKEIKVSSPHMNCDYWHMKDAYTFEYPKIFLLEDDRPFIAFIDDISHKLIITDVSVSNSASVISYPIFEKDSKEEWPILFVKDDVLHLARISDERSSDYNTMYVFSLNRELKKLYPHKEVVFERNKRCRLYSLYPMNGKFMLVGDYMYFCGRYWLYMFLGGDPTYRQHISFTLEQDKVSSMQKIEEDECVSAAYVDYAVSPSGRSYSAWIRWAHDRLGLKHDESVVYSMNQDGNGWSNPVELYSVKDTEEFWQLNNLSVTSSGDSLFIVWRDIRNGIYFTETKEGHKHHAIKIADESRVGKSSRSFYPDATMKVTSDGSSNVYVVWSYDGNGKELLFKARIDGQWTENMTIVRSSRALKQPDIKVDKRGSIHITYIREDYTGDAKRSYSCYYVKIEKVPQDKKS